MADIDIPSAASLRDDLRATIATLTAERDAARGDRCNVCDDDGLIWLEEPDATGCASPLEKPEACPECGGTKSGYASRMKAERDTARRERDEARRSGLTLTAEERGGLFDARAAIGWQRSQYLPGSVEEKRWAAAWNVVDRIFNGARTVTEPTAEEVEAVVEYLADAYSSGVETERIEPWHDVARAAIAAGLDPSRLKEGT